MDDACESAWAVGLCANAISASNWTYQYDVGGMMALSFIFFICKTHASLGFCNDYSIHSFILQVFIENLLCASPDPNIGLTEMTKIKSLLLVKPIVQWRRQTINTKINVYVV